MLFVWSGDTTKEDTFRNWAKAQLIVMAISVGLTILFGIVFGVAIAEMLYCCNLIVEMPDRVILSGFIFSVFSLFRKRVYSNRDWQDVRCALFSKIGLDGFADKQRGAVAMPVNIILESLVRNIHLTKTG